MVGVQKAMEYCLIHYAISLSPIHTNSSIMEGMQALQISPKEHAHLSIFFIPGTDGYYEIRKVITSYLTVSDVINLLVALNYHYSVREFRECIEYSCFYKGVLIESMVSPRWNCSHELCTNKKIYSRKEIKFEIEEEVLQWMDMIHTGRGPFQSIFNISCENSEFKYYLEMCISTKRRNYTAEDTDLIGTIWINNSVESKYAPSKRIDIWFPMSQDDNYISTPILSSELSRLLELVNTFCNTFLIPVRQYRPKFIDTYNLMIGDID